LNREAALDHGALKIVGQGGWVRGLGQRCLGGKKLKVDRTAVHPRKSNGKGGLNSGGRKKCGGLLLSGTQKFLSKASEGRGMGAILGRGGAVVAWAWYRLGRKQGLKLPRKKGVVHLRGVDKGSTSQKKDITIAQKRGISRRQLAFNEVEGKEEDDLKRKNKMSFY